MCSRLVRASRRRHFLFVRFLIPSIYSSHCGSGLRNDSNVSQRVLHFSHSTMVCISWSCAISAFSNRCSGLDTPTAMIEEDCRRALLALMQRGPQFTRPLGLVHFVCAHLSFDILGRTNIFLMAQCVVNDFTHSTSSNFMAKVTPSPSLLPFYDPWAPPKKTEECSSLAIGAVPQHFRLRDTFSLAPPRRSRREQCSPYSIFISMKEGIAADIGPQSIPASSSLLWFQCMSVLKGLPTAPVPRDTKEN